MKIRHDETGQVVESVYRSTEIEGVEHWKCFCDHRRYFAWDGWREVPEPVWVDAMEQCLPMFDSSGICDFGIRHTGYVARLPYGYRLKKIHAHILPDDWVSEAEHWIGPQPVLRDWLNSHKGAVLVLEKMKPQPTPGDIGASTP